MSWLIKIAADIFSIPEIRSRMSKKEMLYILRSLDAPSKLKQEAIELAIENRWVDVIKEASENSDPVIAIPIVKFFGIIQDVGALLRMQFQHSHPAVLQAILNVLKERNISPKMSIQLNRPTFVDSISGEEGSPEEREILKETITPYMDVRGSYINWLVKLSTDWGMVEDSSGREFWGKQGSGCLFVRNHPQVGQQML